MSDKLPLKSKKFLAYLIADLGWKIAIFYFLYQLKGKIDHYSFGVMLTLIIVSGFIQVGYILGQAALDKYVKVSEALTDKKQEEKKK